MENAFNHTVRQKLLSRRDRIVSILRNLEIQRMALSKRALVQDDMMEPIRTVMLDSLDGWYHRELNEVDNALAREPDRRFGICLGCNCDIEANRLEKCPEAEFCRTCEELKKWMVIG